MFINFNNDVIECYKATSLSMEHMGSVLFILMAMYNNAYELLDLYDEYNRDRRILLLYTHLMMRGFIDEAIKEETVNYVLTKKGIEFVESIIKKFGDESVDKVVEEMLEHPTSWIDEWLEMWPEDNGNGRKLRTNKGECLARMAWFHKQYPQFTRDDIMAATKLYISEQSRSGNGLMYTRNSTYFISKQEGSSRNDKVSDLATWCERIGNSGDFTTNANVYDKLI